MTLNRLLVAATLLALAFCAPARAAEDVEMWDAFAAAFGERGAVLVQADKPEHPPGCDCRGLAGPVTLDVLPEALFSLDGRRYALVASESDIHPSHADPGAIAIAYMERTTAGWRTVRVWREFAWSGSNGDPFDRVVGLASRERRIAVFREDGGQGQVAKTAWIIAIAAGGPKLLGHVPAGGSVDAQACPAACVHYAYDGMIGPPTHAGAALSMTYGGWTSPPGRPKRKTPFAVTVDYNEADGVLRPERDARLPDGTVKAAPGDDSRAARALVRLPPATPQAFADQLVALLGPLSRTAGPGRLWDRWYDSLYDPGFRALIDDNRELEARPPSDLFLDHDPLCECNGAWDHVEIRSITRRPDGMAVVRAAYCGPRAPAKGPAETCLEADLVIASIDGAWKLYDVLEPTSLRDLLTRENDRRRGQKIELEDQ